MDAFRIVGGPVRAGPFRTSGSKLWPFSFPAGFSGIARPVKCPSVLIMAGVPPFISKFFSVALGPTSFPFTLAVGRLIVVLFIVSSV